MKFWNKIEPIFKKFVDAVITPIIDFFNSIINEIVNLWDTIWWNGVYKVIEEIINFLTSFSVLEDIGLVDSKSDLSDAKTEEEANERNRRATFVAERKKLQNAQKFIDKQASEKAVKDVISKYKSNQKTTTIKDMTAFTNQTDSGIVNLSKDINETYKPTDTNKYNKTDYTNPRTGGNKKEKFTEQFLGGLKNNIPIINSIKKKKQQYIKKYHKRIDNIVKINYPVCHKGLKRKH